MIDLISFPHILNTLVTHVLYTIIESSTTMNFKTNNTYMSFNFKTSFSDFEKFNLFYILLTLLNSSHFSDP